LVEISDDLERYSAALGSPVIYPIELALGDTESIGKVGRALEAGSRALQKLSPLIEEQDVNSNLSEIEILSRNALLINKASKEITQVFSESESINPQGLLSPLK
ncbi:MAG: hypothetical protein ACKO96_18035, partial [Flammeovirgaceae bacterium]